MSAESQRVCANCGHPKRGHEFPRTEGGHGGGTSGRCVVYSCGCPQFVSTDEFKDQEYSGGEVPKWVVEGAKVKVKRTPMTRKYGLGSGNDTVWPGEIGVVERVDGIGWWTWNVRFSRGNTISLNESSLENLIRVRR